MSEFSGFQQKAKNTKYAKKIENDVCSRDLWSLVKMFFCITYGLTTYGIKHTLKVTPTFIGASLGEKHPIKNAFW